MRGKKGQEMAFSTIIVTVLAIILLILVITFLTGGFKTFREKIGIYSSESNVDSVVDQCNFLVEQDSAYDYCCVNKTIKLSASQSIQMSCSSAFNQSWAGSRIKELKCGGIC